ncbi:MAG: F0F1 ATP synthase subunit alpha, partial [Terriglobales bacterium]
DQYSPLQFGKQILIIFAGTNGFLDDLPVEQCREFEMALYTYADTMNPGLLKAIETKKVLDDDLKAQMTKLIKESKERFVSERQMAAKA